MAGLSAVVFIPDDTAKTGYLRPTMLQNIMGSPLLGWLADALLAGGVGRFFLVCHERYRREVRACFPEDVEFWCPSAETTSDQLHVFLSTADESEEDIIVVTGPAVILPFAADEEEFEDAPVVSPVTSVNRQTLMEALDDLGIWYCGGKNSPYIWMQCPGGMGSWETFDLLLNEIQVIGTPGEGFGACGEGYFRFSTFGSPEDTKEAAARIRKLFVGMGNK